MSNPIHTPYFKSCYLNQFFGNSFAMDTHPKKINDIAISKFLYYDKYQVEYFKRTRNINDLCYDLWKIIDVEYNLIADKKIHPEHSYYNNFMQRMKQMPIQLSDQCYYIMALIYIEKSSVHPHWNILNSLKEKQKNKILNDILSFEFLNNDPLSIDFIFDNFSIDELENIKVLGGNSYKGKLVKMIPYNIDIKTKSIRDLMDSPKKDWNNNIYKLKKINEKLNLDCNPSLIIEDVDLKFLLPESLNIIQEPSLNAFTTEYSINNNNIMVSLENIAQFNFMNKSFSNLIKNQTSYGLDGQTYPDFLSLKEHFLQYTFLKLHMEDYIIFKSKNSRTNNPKWQYLILEDTIEHKDTVTIKRNKL